MHRAQHASAHAATPQALSRGNSEIASRQRNSFVSFTKYMFVSMLHMPATKYNCLFHFLVLMHACVVCLYKMYACPQPFLFPPSPKSLKKGSAHVAQVEFKPCALRRPNVSRFRVHLLQSSANCFKSATYEPQCICNARSWGKCITAFVYHAS